MDHRSVLLRRVVCAVLALSALPALGQQELDKGYTSP